MNDKPEVKVNSVSFTRDNFLVFLDRVIYALTQLADNKDENNRKEEARLSSKEELIKALEQSVLYSSDANKFIDNDALAFRKSIRWWKRPKFEYYAFGGHVDTEATRINLKKFGYTAPSKEVIITSILGQTSAEFITAALVRAKSQGVSPLSLAYVLHSKNYAWTLDYLFTRAGYPHQKGETWFTNDFRKTQRYTEAFNHDVATGTEATYTIDLEKFRT